MNSLVLVTSSFPYEGGEQFLESEIEHWSNTKFDNIYIAPYSTEGGIRVYPKHIKIIKPEYVKPNIVYVFLSLLDSIFYKELLYIIRNTKFSEWKLNFQSALKTVALTLKLEDILKDSLNHIDGDITVYSYWNDVSFYAACMLKRKGVINHVISRAHGFDIYEDRRPNNYMPLKRQFMKDFDTVYLLSKNALTYYSRLYKVTSKPLSISRLGVKIPSVQPPFKVNNNKISVLSISYCVEVKQINKIILAIEEYARMNDNLNIEWTHIGDGPLFEELKFNAYTLIPKYSNIDIHFIGHLDNKEVMNVLQNNSFDLFINTSKSEGIPVSIMEAMSYGIPAIAPDVGEVSELVNESNGYLLPKHFSTEDIIKGINTIVNSNNREYYRSNAVHWIEKYFNSNINYPLFISQVERSLGLHNINE